MQIYLQFLFRARNFSCEFWSVFYVNYAGCYPACGFLICCLGAFLPINPLFGKYLRWCFLICCLGGCAPLPRAPPPCAFVLCS